jgi:hypothetical protein
MKANFPLLIAVVIVLLLSACNLPTGDEPTSTVDEMALRTSVAETLLADADPTQTPGPDTPTDEQPPPPSNTPEPEQPPTDTVKPSPTDTLEPTPTFSITPSPTDTTPRVSVSVDTNCRSGPGVEYDLLGALLVGETAKIVARAETGFYWIIENPDKAGTCWLWAEYATTTGDTSGLLVMTAPPSPTPSPTLTPALAFTVQYNNYHNCGGTIYVTFYVANTGSMPLESAEVAVVQIAGTVSLFDGWTDVPFVGTSNGCPPELAMLAPGAAGYIAVPVGPAPAPPPTSGAHAATFNICSADGLGGACLLRELSFTVP